MSPFHLFEYSVSGRPPVRLSIRRPFHTIEAPYQTRAKTLRACTRINTIVFMNIDGQLVYPDELLDKLYGMVDINGHEFMKDVRAVMSIQRN